MTAGPDIDQAVSPFFACDGRVVRRISDGSVCTVCEADTALVNPAETAVAIAIALNEKHNKETFHDNF